MAATLLRHFYAVHVSLRGCTETGRRYWEAVQAKLQARKGGRGRPPLLTSHFLTGRIRDAHGVTLSPSHVRKGAVRHRYYVSRAVLPKEECRAFRTARLLR